MKKTDVYSITQSLDHCDHITHTALAGYPELAADHLLNKEMREKLIQTVVLAPHIGSASLENRTKMSIMAAENLLTVLKGKAAHQLS